MARVRLASKDFWKRAGLLSMVALFVITALGFGLLAFWQSTNQDPATKDQQQVAACQFSGSYPSTAVNKPEVFKPAADVTKLETTDLKEGTGEAVKPGDCLAMKYYGTLAASGELFDENYSLPTALKIQIGTGQVIPGWDEGIIGMKTGGERRLVIPSELGYGPTGNGSIPPNSDLVFVVQLERIIKQ